MEIKERYLELSRQIGFDANWEYHRIFRSAYAGYLEQVAMPFLRELKFKKVIYLFLDHATSLEKDNLAKPLPFMANSSLSDFARALWTGFREDEAPRYNREVFFELLRNRSRENGEAIPVVLLNLLPTEGALLHSGAIRNITLLLCGTRDDLGILKDLVGDMRKLSKVTNPAETFFLFGVRPECYEPLYKAIVVNGHLPDKALNKFIGANCGASEGIDPELFRSFLESVGSKDQTYCDEQGTMFRKFIELMDAIRKRE